MLENFQFFYLQKQQFIYKIRKISEFRLKSNFYKLFDQWWLSLKSTR